MSLLISFSIFPLDKGVSVSSYVARAARIIRDSGLSYGLGPMSTNIEGEWDDVFAAVKRCHEVIHEMGAPRIFTVLKVGTRTDREQSMGDKVKSVQEKL